MTTQGVKSRQGSPASELEPVGPIVLRLHPAVRISDEQFFELCALNDSLRIELNARGDMELMAPAGGSTSNKNFRINIDFGIWVRTDGTGVGFDSSGEFTLPNGAVRSPDAAWVLKDRWQELTEEERRRFPPIAPDFVVELRSESDRLEGLQAKMQEYMDNGVRLGWLIDPLDPQCRVYVYRPDAAVEIMEGPETVSGDPELPGFTLDLKPMWEPG